MKIVQPKLSEKRVKEVGCLLPTKPQLQVDFGFDDYRRN